MDGVIVLVSAPGGPPLTTRETDGVRAALADQGVHSGPLAWLAAERAAEFGIAGDIASCATAAQAALGAAPVDYAVLPPADRRKKLLVADMDSTIITVECIDELADFADIKAEIAAITERAMRGELEFEDALVERVARLKGLTNEILGRVYEERVRLSPGARTLVRTMRAQGARTILVSGGFTFFADRVGDAAGFDEVHANALEIADGRLTGRVIPPIVGPDAKLATLKARRADLGLAPTATMAIGDGANDIPMMAESGLGIAFHAKPAAVAAADAVIRHGDLTTALYFQGYREAEITS